MGTFYIVKDEISITQCLLFITAFADPSVKSNRKQSILNVYLSLYFGGWIPVCDVLAENTVSISSPGGKASSETCVSPVLDNFQSLERSNLALRRRLRALLAWFYMKLVFDRGS